MTLHGVTSTQLRRTLTHIDVCLSYVHPSASQLWRSSSHHQRSYCRTPTDTGPFWPNTDVTLTDMNRGCDICVRKCSKMLEEFCDSPKFTDRPWLTLTQRKWNVGIRQKVSRNTLIQHNILTCSLPYPEFSYIRKQLGSEWDAEKLGVSFKSKLFDIRQKVLPKVLPKVEGMWYA